MSKTRNTNLPQHELDQGHYGELVLNELPSATGYPSGTAFLWDSSSWYFGSVSTGSGSSSGPFEFVVGGAHDGQAQFTTGVNLLTTPDQQAYLYISGDFIEISDGADGTVNLDDFNGKIYMESRNGVVLPILAADPIGADSEEGQAYYNSVDNVIHLYDGVQWNAISGSSGGTGDHKVLGSANDTTANYLIPKLSGTGNVTLYQYNDGGNEIVVISGTAGAAADEKVKVTSNDTTAGYLIPKVSGSAGIDVYEYNDGGNEILVISGSVDASLHMILGDGSSVISLGVKGYIEVPFDCNIKSGTLLADTTGIVVVNLYKDTYGNYPPTSGDAITGSSPLMISNSNKTQDTTLPGWQTRLAAGDVIAVNIDNCVTIEQVTVSIKVQIR